MLVKSLIIIACMSCCRAIPVSIRLLPAAYNKRNGGSAVPLSINQPASSRMDRPMHLDTQPPRSQSAQHSARPQHSNHHAHNANAQLDHALWSSFRVPEPSSPVAAFFLAPHKTASVFVNELLHSITMATDRCWYRIAQQSRSGVCADYGRCTINRSMIMSHYFKPAPLFCPNWTRTEIEALHTHTLAQWKEPALQHPVALHGFTYGPIRIHQLPGNTYTRLQQMGFDTLLVFHRRHPLDQIVSEYYSFAFTHPPPNKRTASQEQIDEFYEHQHQLQVQGVDAYARVQFARDIWWESRYGLYFAHLAQPKEFQNVRVLHSKYEDMVLTFPTWLAALLEALRVDSKQLLDYMVKKHGNSFQADGKHKRHVLPGAHKQDLNTSTIASLWDDYGDKFSLLGYKKD
eukprot:m.30882 g.30882  ORF g.30882 m.30882 type:complete len:402 (+) comp12011_c0_seq1:200-1405(+)